MKTKKSFFGLASILIAAAVAGLVSFNSPGPVSETADVTITLTSAGMSAVGETSATATDHGVFAKCDSGSEKDKDKGKDKDKDGDGEKKCGEGDDKKCGEGKCGEGDSGGEG